ncbi:hypothetical protein VYU27_007343 [Nannochloropsis oceanica]
MVVVDSASAVHSLAPKKLPLGPTGWNHLSVEMMHQIARFCQLQDVARFHLLCRAWCEGLEQSAFFYPEICQTHWASPLCDLSLAAYRGSWRMLFLSSVAATAPISELLDQGITALTSLKEREEGVEEGREEEGEEVEGEVKVLSQTKSVRGLFEAFMKATFDLGRKLELGKVSPHSRAFQAYLEATGRILRTSALMRACLFDFIRHTEELSMHYDVWNGGFVEWPSVPWRRSAIDFVSDFYVAKSVLSPSRSLPPSLPPSTTSSSTRDKQQQQQQQQQQQEGEGGEGKEKEEQQQQEEERQSARLFAPGLVKALDITIGSTIEEALELFVPPVPGIPAGHWWWWGSIQITGQQQQQQLSAAMGESNILKGRHYMQLFILALLFMFAIFTRKSIWIYYTVLIIFAAVLFIVDILFQDFQFVFDPDPNNWRRKTDPQY